MKYIYLIGGYDRREEIAAFGGLLPDRWRIAYRWWEEPAEQIGRNFHEIQRVARRELGAACQSDLVLRFPGGKGTSVELGAAIASGVPVWAIGRDPYTDNRDRAADAAIAMAKIDRVLDLKQLEFSPDQDHCELGAALAIAAKVRATGSVPLDCPFYSLIDNWTGGDRLIDGVKHWRRRSPFLALVERWIKSEELAIEELR